MVHPCSVLPRR